MVRSFIMKNEKMIDKESQIIRKGNKKGKRAILKLINE